MRPAQRPERGSPRPGPAASKPGHDSAGQRNSISFDKKPAARSRGTWEKEALKLSIRVTTARRLSHQDGVDLRVRTVVCAITLGPKKQTARVELRHFNFELGFAVYGPLGAVYIPVILSWLAQSVSTGAGKQARARPSRSGGLFQIEPCCKETSPDCPVGVVPAGGGSEAGHVGENLVVVEKVLPPDGERVGELVVLHQLRARSGRSAPPIEKRREMRTRATERESERESDVMGGAPAVHYVY